MNPNKLLLLVTVGFNIIESIKLIIKFAYPY